jgi:tRNA-dihydrouridine synthase
MRESKSERVALIEFRKHLVGYLRGFELAKTARVALLQARDEAAFLRLLEALEESPRALALAS